MKWLLFLIPFAVPPVFHWFYQPLNEAWTVKAFGCGCPPLDLSWKFNANHFNGILWLVLFFECLGILVSVSRILFDEPKSLILCYAFAALGMECLWFWGHEVWL
jgi:hypothetical protein